MSTCLRENGFIKEYVEAQLNHVEKGASGTYNKAIYLSQRKDMMEWYSQHLYQLFEQYKRGLG
ncbi:MAG: hypothetical protein ACKVK5_16045 [Pseudomonadales bacterium]